MISSLPLAVSVSAAESQPVITLACDAGRWEWVVVDQRNVVASMGYDESPLASLQRVV